MYVTFLSTRFLPAMISSRSDVVTQFVHPYLYFYFGTIPIFTVILTSRDEKGSIGVCFKSVSRVSQVFQGCFKGVSSVFQECLMDVSRMSYW